MRRFVLRRSKSQAGAKQNVGEAPSTARNVVSTERSLWAMLCVVVANYTHF